MLIKKLDMILSLVLNNRSYNIDLSAYTDISVPMLFNGDQPNTYDVEKQVPELMRPEVL